MIYIIASNQCASTALIIDLMTLKCAQHVLIHLHIILAQFPISVPSLSSFEYLCFLISII